MLVICAVLFPLLERAAMQSPHTSSSTSNPAVRLLALLTSFPSMPSASATATDVWLNAATMDGLPVLQPTDKYETALKAILAAKEDAQRLRVMLGGVSDTPEDTEYLDQLDLGFVNSIANLQNHWGAVEAYFGPNVRTALKFWVRQLPAEDHAVSPDALTALISTLQEMLAEVTQDETIATAERDRIYRLVMLLVEALRGYAIAGQPALQKGIRDWIAAVRETYRSHPPTEVEKSMLLRSWTKLNEVAKPIIDADALLSAAARLGPLVALVATQASAVS